MNDYERIARIIRYLEAHRADQPSLAELCAQVGLGESHFHRLFARWVGVTPKDFLQALTFADAKARLQLGASALDASIDAGLSGPGRLHDLCVSIEAASPGEMKTGGKGIPLVAGFADSPFGECYVAESPRGVAFISFLERAEAEESLRAAWPQAAIQRNDERAAEWAQRIFSVGVSMQPLKAYVRASGFQLKVWRALLEIPLGATATYGNIARRIGQPSAARAVGNAVGANVLGYLIPCHRVIRETGITGGYRWGTERKRAMLAWESLAGHHKRLPF